MTRSKIVHYLWLAVLLIPVLASLVLMRETVFRFAHKDYLWLLCALAPAIILFTYFNVWRENHLLRFGNVGLIDRLIPDSSFYKHLVKFILFALAFEFVVIGFAAPQLGTHQEKVKRQGIDVILALDVSNSMLSEDVKPSRLDRARNFMTNFIDSLENDRLGLIVFAGRAYLQMPLTVDYGAAKMYIKSVNTNMVPTQGTNIAEAVDMARNAFVAGENAHKALIIISDGEDNEGGVDEALNDAVKAGIKVFTIGVGSDEGSPIPMGGDFKRDENGNIVLSKMNPDMLRDIADKGNGKFFRLGSGKDEIAAIFKEL
ncbi:MAG TPA: VWA domain-containing protein, partial [Chitinophagales bacterium]|nr:VWA domain-containing protein [Chitinophagales bacterium]